MNTPDPRQQLSNHIIKGFLAEEAGEPPPATKLVMPDGSPVVIEPPPREYMLEFFMYETVVTG